VGGAVVVTAAGGALDPGLDACACRSESFEHAVNKTRHADTTTADNRMRV
jgi:hypothetical protein